MPVFAVRDVMMHAVDEGVARPVVFLHGLPFDHSLWEHQRRELRSEHRVIIPDLRGFGRTSLGTRTSLTLQDYADDVLALLEAAEVCEPVVLCGLSMGCYLALLLGLQAPERWRGLVLCNGRAAADTPQAAAQREEMAQRVLKEGSQVLVQALLPKLFSPLTRQHQPHVVETVKNVMERTSPQTLATVQRAMAARVDLTERLSHITCPCLVIAGSDDPISPPSEMQAWSQRLPHSQFFIVPDASHLAPLEQPEMVNHHLRTFLARLF
ncbi:MAG: alpha/beta hydrolase [Planctomycetaceae bacterium]|nr:MAG: alpha/beta hydrolase [Planctomycetaceae bacterium]